MWHPEIHPDTFPAPDHGRSTDKLYLNYMGGEHTWKQGEVISQYEAVITPAPDRNPKTEN